MGSREYINIAPSGITELESSRKVLTNFGGDKGYNILYRAKFYMSMNEMTHKKIAFGLLDFLSEAGGLISVLILIIGVLGAEDTNV